MIKSLIRFGSHFKGPSQHFIIKERWDWQTQDMSDINNWEFHAQSTHEWRKAGSTTNRTGAEVGESPVHVSKVREVVWQLFTCERSAFLGAKPLESLGFIKEVPSTRFSWNSLELTVALTPEMWGNSEAHVPLPKQETLITNSLELCLKTQFLVALFNPLSRKQLPQPLLQASYPTKQA